jgi:hypothetical protein
MAMDRPAVGESGEPRVGPAVGAMPIGAFARFATPTTRGLVP